MTQFHSRMSIIGAMLGMSAPNFIGLTPTDPAPTIVSGLSRTRSRVHCKARPAGSKLARKAAAGQLGTRHMTQQGLTLKSHFERAYQRAA